MTKHLIRLSKEDVQIVDVLLIISCRGTKNHVHAASSQNGRKLLLFRLRSTAVVPTISS